MMNFDEIKAALELEDFTPFYEKADDVCRQMCGDIVHIRGIVEFSNYCKQDCAYCGLRQGNALLDRYRMPPEEIVETSVRAWEAGYKTIVLQSGEDPWYTVEIIGRITSEIKSKTNLNITLACGEFSYEDYVYFKQHGADRYLLKHETSDEEIYAKLHPGIKLKDRIACLVNIKKAELETGSGFMIGLPGQTAATIANDILLLKELECDMAGIGPFLPNPLTPLKDIPPGSSELTRRVVALARLIMPRLNLPATTALGVLDKEGRDNTFSGGANVIMKKVTPLAYRSMYEIYPIANKNYKSITEERMEIEDLIKGLGKRPV